MMKKHLLLLLFLSPQIFANSGGITGRSGQQNLNCSSSGCHSGESYNSSLSFDGSTVVEPGQNIDLSVLLSFTPPTGVPTVMAGINIAASSGTLSGGVDTKTVDGELTHTPAGLTALTNNQKAWDFSWTAPSTEGDVTLYACAEAVNRNFTNSGDDSTAACLTQTISVQTTSEPPTPEPEPTQDTVRGDIDGDGRADYLAWRPSTQTYYSKSSKSKVVIHRAVLGENEYAVPLVGDVDGNGIDDVVTWQPEGGQWDVVLDSGQTTSFTLGTHDDYPFLVDRDGDGKADPMIRRPSEGKWYYLASGSGYDEKTFSFGSKITDVPTLGHYDDDGKIDFGIWRSGTWYMRWSSDNVTRTKGLGTQSTDIPTPADYDGDGITDIAIWRPTTGKWYVYYSSGVYPEGGTRYERVFGSQSSDIPVPADYDGDGKADLAIRRPSTFEFIYLSSMTGDVVKNVFGKQNSDIAVLAAWKIKQEFIHVNESPGEGTGSVSDYVQGDIDGDKRADFLAWRPSTQTYYSKSSKSLVVIHRSVLGSLDSGVPLIGDIDGDGEGDIAVFQPETGIWDVEYFDGSTGSFNLGKPGDYPFLFDRDGDGKDDIVVRRPSNGTWYYLASKSDYSEQSFAFGKEETDIPVVGHYDNDGKVDFAIWRSGTWYMRWSSDNKTRTKGLGTKEEDIPVPADYDGDGLTDIAIWRPSTGRWYIYYSSGVYPAGGSRYERNFGSQSTDIPIAADYDGDGKADLAIRRPTTNEFIYLSSKTQVVTRVGFAKQSTDIPALSAWKASQSLLNEPGVAFVDTQPYYNENISAQIVQSKCIGCHIANGQAGEGIAKLQFVDANTTNYQSINQQRIIDFLALEGVDSTYLLTKAQGGLTHGGASQIVFGSDEYESLSTYLDLLSGGDNSGKSSGDFWEGVGLLDSKQTLRKAALIFSGRLPTQAEYDSVADNKEASLKTAVRNVMQGDSFHQFLTEGANDRLLTEKFLDRGADFLDSNRTHFPALANEKYQQYLAGNENEFNDANGLAVQGFAKAAPELIAYVIENEKPYSEILTADYTMVTPLLSKFYQSNASFTDESNDFEFVPAKIEGFMLHDENYQSEFFEGLGALIYTEGEIITWPHAGILNDPAFLGRYPSTATNRNRARSRWAQYFFLDFDIEKSAARTNDPDALADKDNPTMKNPNCTVCHIPMDPVAGAFQNYGDNGWYRDQYGGKDALPDTYKWPEGGNSLYQEGDTWYRDMREPGFYGEKVPDADHSLQWLAQQIINDDRFAVSAIKFWWPALIGSAPVYAPEISSDYDYQSKTAVYNAQSAFMNTVADSLRNHMNLKDSFVDVVISPWFRASDMTEEATLIHASDKTGTGRLLSPELLDRKTTAVVGYTWGEHYPEWMNYQRYTNLLDQYKLTYGGIDSDGVIKRAEEMTSIMSQVALTNAAETACGAVYTDFVKDDEDRVMFQGISKLDVPGVVDQKTVDVTGFKPENSSVYSLNMQLEQGAHSVNVAFLDDLHSDELQRNKDLIIDKFIIKNSSGTIVQEYDGGELLDLGGVLGCGDQHHDELTGIDFNIWGNCTVELPINIETAGQYTIEVHAYRGLWDMNDWGWAPEEEANSHGAYGMNMSVTVANPLLQTSATSIKIKEKIVTLVGNFWGEFLSTEDPEIERIYQLFINSMTNKKQRGEHTHIEDQSADCSFQWHHYDDAVEGMSGWDLGNDPQYAMSAWRTVLIYLMSDYKYLHE